MLYIRRGIHAEIMKYAYPAIIRQEDGGLYSVEFPDIDGCVTSGESLPDAIEMAEDALSLMLYDMEEEGEAIPAPSNLKDVSADADALVSTPSNVTHWAGRKCRSLL